MKILKINSITKPKDCTIRRVYFSPKVQHNKTLSDNNGNIKKMCSAKAVKDYTNNCIVSALDRLKKTDG